jgi:putative transposase
MAHSKVKIWVHGIIGTKDHERLIKPDIEKIIHNKIKQQLIEQKCYVDIIDGTLDHIHVLFLLHPDLTIRKVIKQVKGGSSYQLNRMDSIIQKIYWQIGYSAFSVSESQITKVREYIKNQKKHHKKMTFKEEYDKIMRLHKIENG